MSDRVKFKLAHPLRTEDADELGLESRTYEVGTEIVLPRAYAMRLVGSGFVAGADPRDVKSVNAALTPVPDHPAVTEKPATVGDEQPPVGAAAVKPKPAKNGSGE